MAGADDLSLSESYFPLTVTTLAGTPKASPQSTTVAIPPAVLTEVNVLIPPGHSGQTGIQFVFSGRVIVPFGGAVADAWIIGDDANPVFAVSFPIAASLQIRTYNAGLFDHNHYLRLKVDYNAISAGSGRPVLAIVPVA